MSNEANDTGTPEEVRRMMEAMASDEKKSEPVPETKAEKLEDPGEGDEEETEETSESETAFECEDVWILVGTEDEVSDGSTESTITTTSVSVLGWARKRERVYDYGEKLRRVIDHRIYKSMLVLPGKLENESGIIRFSDAQFKATRAEEESSALISSTVVKDMKLVKVYYDPDFRVPKIYRKFYESRFDYFSEKYDEMMDFIDVEMLYDIKDSHTKLTSRRAVLTLKELRDAQTHEVVSPFTIDAMHARFINH